jgi:uncharacterized protein (DUF1697 family)
LVRNSSLKSCRKIEDVKYVALLRGIGPTNPNMRNEKLAGVFKKLGFKNVKPVISTGNIIFESSSRNVSALEAKLEEAFPKYLGFKSATIIRRQEDLDRLIKQDPYKGKPHGEKNYTLVAFVKNHSGAIRKFPAKGRGFRVCGRYKKELCTVVDLKNTHTPDLMRIPERELGKDITTRTWNTILKIQKAFE